MADIHNNSIVVIYFGMSNEENWLVLPIIFAKIWCQISWSPQNQLFLTFFFKKFWSIVPKFAKKKKKKTPLSI
jgi:hypothetical protein